MSMSSHQSAYLGTDTWLTPPEIINALGPFDYDPCPGPEPKPWETADKYPPLGNNGLFEEWKGTVWLNPPFGNQTGDWFRKLADHGDGIGLCAARTETRWFVSQIWKRADAILFLHGRPHFHYPDGKRGEANSGVPICLVGYGAIAMSKLMNCNLAGSLVMGWSSHD